MPYKASYLNIMPTEYSVVYLEISNEYAECLLVNCTHFLGEGICVTGVCKEVFLLRAATI